MRYRIRSNNVRLEYWSGGVLEQWIETQHSYTPTPRSLTRPEISLSGLHQIFSKPRVYVLPLSASNTFSAVIGRVVIRTPTAS